MQESLLTVAGSVVGRFGMIFGRSDVSGTATGPVTATRSGWDPGFGIGIQRRIAYNSALRLDADRCRFRFSGGEHGKVNALTVGLQWSLDKLFAPEARKACRANP